MTTCLFIWTKHGPEKKRRSTFAVYDETRPFAFSSQSVSPTCVRRLFSSPGRCTLLDTIVVVFCQPRLSYKRTTVDPPERTSVCWFHQRQGDKMTQVFLQDACCDKHYIEHFRHHIFAAHPSACRGFALLTSSCFHLTPECQVVIQMKLWPEANMKQWSTTWGRLKNDTTSLNKWVSWRSMGLSGP